MNVRSMFRGTQRYEIDDVMFTKFRIYLEPTPLYQLFLKHFDTNLETEMMSAFDNRLDKKEWEERKWYLNQQIFSKKKQRWVKKAITDYEEKKDKKPRELYGYYLGVKKTIESQKKHNLPVVMTLEEAVAEQMEALVSWGNSEENFTEYPFINDKTPGVTRTAIMDDITREFLMFLVREWDEEARLKQPKKGVRDFPIGHTQIIFDNSVRKSPTKFDGELTVDGEVMPYKELGNRERPIHMVPKNEHELAELATQLGMTDSIRDLDYIDRDIIASFVEHRTEEFAVNSTIRAPLRDILTDVFDSANGNNYDSLVSRIANLSRVKYLGLGKDKGDLYGFGIFNYFRFYGPNNNMVEVQFSKYLHDNYINHQTLRIYREQLNQLDKPMYSFLLFIQQERITAYKLGKTNTKITWDWFRDNIRMEVKRKKEVREEIIKSLELLVERKLLVQSFEYGADLFYIKFIPMDENEVRDIVNYGDETASETINEILGSKKRLLDMDK